MMKPIFCALALFTMLAPAMAQDAATPPAEKSPFEGLGDLATFGQRPPTPTLTKDGLTITAIERPVDHVAEMLDISLWQFKVEPPKPTSENLMLHYSLQLQRPGRDSIEIDSGGTGFTIYQAPRTLEFTFGLKPESGKSLHRSDYLETYHATQIWNLPNATGGSRGEGGGDTNPLKDLVYSQSSSSPLPNIGIDGRIVLMDFMADGSTKYDTELVLILTLQTPQPKN